MIRVCASGPAFTPAMSIRRLIGLAVSLVVVAMVWPAPAGAAVSVAPVYEEASYNACTNPGSLPCEADSVAVDGQGNAWFGDSSQAALAKLPADGSAPVSVVTPSLLPSATYIPAVAYSDGSIYFAAASSTWKIYSLPADAPAHTAPTLVVSFPPVAFRAGDIGLAVTSSGDVYWDDGASPGTVFVHRHGTSPSSRDVFATGFDVPSQMAFGPDGKLYVADYGDGKVMAVGPQGGVASVYASGAALGGALSGLAFAPDDSGTLFVVDGDLGNVQGVSEIARTASGTAGAISLVVPNPGSFSWPDGLAFGTSGLLMSDLGEGYVDSITGLPLAPSAPQNLTVATTSTSITVTWDTPAYVGSGIERYQLTAQPGGTTCTVAPPTMTCTFNTLNPATTYSFAATATNAWGTSGPSSLTATTPTAPTTTPPTTTPSESLPATGSNLVGLLTIGSSLVVGGIVLARRRARNWAAR